MTAPLAHAGHWYHALLYVSPVIIVAFGLWWSGRREARDRERREGSPPAGDQD